MSDLLETDNLKDLVFQWMRAEAASAGRLDARLYCETRDVFQARLDAMTRILVHGGKLSEDVAYLTAAIAGEIGNNSFDPNLGSWPDVPGIFFGYDERAHQIILADRGQGIFATLQHVKPELKDDREALQTAFVERLSGRLPERRGNGLKFVRESIASQHFHLTCWSGLARAELNEFLDIQTTQESLRGCLVIIDFSGTLPI